MFQYDVNQNQAAVIKLIGVGGGGGNAVEHMMNANIHGVEYICANTDAQVLSKMGAKSTIQLGTEITKGLGAGTNPDIGRQAAQEDRDHIAQVINGADMLFLTAGMGGGTGTGAIPVIASIAKDLGILTVAVVTKPFPFEGGKRRQVAEEGLIELRQHVDSLIVVPNEKLLTNLGPNVTVLQAFKAANDVLKNAVQGIAEIITNPGLINVDFADVRAVMLEMGKAMMGTGSGHGENRALEAATGATQSPLLDDINLKGARGILCNITAGADLSMHEFQQVGDVIEEIAAADANVVIGTSIDKEMEGEIRVTVVATGLADERSKKPMRLVSSDDGKPARNYDQYEKPAAARVGRSGEERPRARVRKSTEVAAPAAGAQLDLANVEREDDELDYLDLPTFLRRQAD
ncbi:MAG: cell division protein FtsZ [Pseudomonadota bacterium]